MARSAQDPPSPVDAYEAPLAPVLAGPPMPPPPYGSASPRYAATAQRGASGDINVLAIIALIASCAGTFIPFADVAGVVMGHIALSQIKRTGERGHGLALAAVIVGYCLVALETLIVVAYVVFIVWIVGVAASSATDFGDFG